MSGRLVGVFGSRQQAKDSFLSSIAKKSEAEGMVVYSRSESGRRYSFMDDPTYPEKVQGYARIAALCDHAYYLFPGDGSLSAADGELAVLIDAMGLDGSIQLIDGSAETLRDRIRTAFSGLRVADFPLVERQSGSSIIDLTSLREKESAPRGGTLIYVDRAFNVKGVGLVALGFVLSGKVSVHDELRPIPGTSGKRAEVKGIQISDEDHDSAERGIRVGLSLRGVELKDLEKTSWLDDGSFGLSRSMSLDFKKSAYYKQPLAGREMHLQFCGETLPASVRQEDGSNVRVDLSLDVPSWNGMRAAVLDLNAKQLRVAGGGAATA